MAGFTPSPLLNANEDCPPRLSRERDKPAFSNEPTASQHV
jgi:hypothetical protein